MLILKQYPQLKIIQELSRKQKVQVFLVGGFLRDYIVGKPKLDFDFAVSKDAIKLARSFAKKIKGAFILLDQENGCARVAKKTSTEIYTFDFADYRAKTFKQDLTHRDFTINTLSVDLNNMDEKTKLDDVIEDHKGALKDIKAKTIRMTSKDVFKEDPLRMLRAFSLKAQLGFKIDPPTLKKIKQQMDLIREVSYERIREELFKILESPRTAQVLKEMDKIDFLVKIIPQIQVMFDCHQGGYHHLHVWPHSLEAVNQLDQFLLENKNSEVEEYLKEEIGGAHSRRSVMKLATLLHDIGKPDTKKIEEGGKMSFHGHEHVGARIVKDISKMLKISTHERYALQDMVRWHLRPGYLGDFKNPSDKMIYRYFRDAKDESASVLILSMADQRATRGPLTSQEDLKHHETICLRVIDQYFLKKKEKPYVPLVNGHDIMKALKIKPSALIGKILDEVKEQHALGKINSKQEALALSKKIMNRG